MSVIIYALAWLSFAVVHSLLARLSIQKKLEHHVKGGYRLLYNALSLVHIGAVFLIGKSLLETQTYNTLSDPIISSLFLAIKLAGVIVIVWSLTKYDLGRFSGITQFRKLEYLSTVSEEPLQRSGLNSWVRHPLYSGAFLYLWGSAGSSFGLWTAILGSLYLIVGTALEERKLITFYGEAYRQYQKEIPMYFPIKIPS